jgi:methyl-accepting chemotaxis protein
MLSRQVLNLPRNFNNIGPTLNAQSLLKRNAPPPNIQVLMLKSNNSRLKNGKIHRVGDIALELSDSINEIARVISRVTTGAETQNRSLDIAASQATQMALLSRKPPRRQVRWQGPWKT